MKSLPAPGIEDPVSLSAINETHIAFLDRGGDRLVVFAGEELTVLAEGLDGVRCAARASALVVLDRSGGLPSFELSRGALGALDVRAGANAIVFGRGGSLIVGFGEDARREHGDLIERIGASPASASPEGVDGATALAAESGGVWVGGARPEPRMVLLRPSPAGYDERMRFHLPAPPIAAEIGPDGALYVLLEPGDKVLRFFAEGDQAVHDLADPPLRDLARAGNRLLGCGPSGLFDLTDLAAEPKHTAPPELPPCDG
ncbi:MAG: hypothetical protein V3T86_15015 [Planctomycetota bacterium]